MHTGAAGGASLDVGALPRGCGPQHLVERGQALGHLHGAGQPERAHAFLHALLAQPGHAVPKERLYELVFPGQLDVQYEAIEVVVYRLRKKLAGTGLTLMTLRGLGYLLRADTA